MTTVLQDLCEQRRLAYLDLERWADPIIKQNRDLTHAEEIRHAELIKKLERLDRKITKAERGSTVTVRNEPKVYQKNSPHSYFCDLARSTNPGWRDHYGAVERLHRHARELAVDSRCSKKERARVTRCLRDANRPRADAAREASMGVELRAMDTTTGSGGSFVTPEYLVSDYAPYRQFGRVFIDQANKQDLPDYGMTVYLPTVTAAAGVGVQTTQGTGVTETDPVSAYLSANLTTQAGQVTLSQQVMDRAGPNFKFDLLVMDQLRRSYNFAVNQAVIAAALASAGTSVTRASQATIPEMYGDIGNAKTQTVDAAGVVLPATHLFATQTHWEWAATRTDSSGHPLIVPPANGVFNSIAAGGGDSIAEGDTGYRMLGLRVFEDGGIPLANANTEQQLIVAHMPEVWVFEGDLVTRTFPQTLAQNLQVLVQVYAYSATIVRYPKAVQVISGQGYPAVPTF